MEYDYDNVFCGNMQCQCQCPYMEKLMQMRAMEMMSQMPRISEEIMNEEVEKSDDINEDVEKYDSESDSETRYQNKADKILRKIQRNNPGIFRRFRRLGVPYPIAVRTCRRIIVLTLMYGNC